MQTTVGLTGTSREIMTPWLSPNHTSGNKDAMLRSFSNDRRYIHLIGDSYRHQESRHSYVVNNGRHSNSQTNKMPYTHFRHIEQEMSKVGVYSDDGSDEMYDDDSCDEDPYSEERLTPNGHFSPVSHQTPEMKEKIPGQDVDRNFRSTSQPPEFLGQFQTSSNDYSIRINHMDTIDYPLSYRDSPDKEMVSFDTINMADKVQGSHARRTKPGNRSRHGISRSGETADGASAKSKEPGTSSILPPCRICGAKASGFHYGVNSCEACKGFFRRALKRPMVFQCTKNSTCNVKGNKRSTCRFCRYQRCLSLGMSREAIKTGRYSHKKRTRDTIEVKRLQNSPHPVSDDSELENTIQTLLSSHDSCLPSSAYVSEDLIYQRQLEYHNFYLLMKNLGPNSRQIITDSTDTNKWEHRGSEHLAEKTRPTDSNDYVKPSSPSSSTTSSQLSADSGFVDDHDFPITDTKMESSNVSCPMNSNGNLSTTGLDLRNTKADCDRISHDSKNNIDYHHRDVDSVAARNCVSSYNFRQHDAHRDVITNGVHRAYDSVCDVIQDQNSEQVFKSSKTHPGNRQSTANSCSSEKHCENSVFIHSKDTQNSDTFRFSSGSRKCPPSTNITSDVQAQESSRPHGWAGSFDRSMDSKAKNIKRAECWIRGYIKFAKTIPGFSELPVEDQGTLLRHAWDEVWLLGAYRGYNTDLGVAVMPGGRCFHDEEMGRGWGRGYTRASFQLAELVKGHNLTPELVALLKAVCIVSPDRCALSEREKVEEIHWLMVTCLLHHIEETCPDDHMMFPRLVSVLTSLRDLSESGQKNAESDDIISGPRNNMLSVFAPF